MDNFQASILRPLPTRASCLTFELKLTSDTKTILYRLESIDIQSSD
jgi:hypothetical protein